MAKTINILFFSGPGVGPNCFKNTKSILDNANKPGYIFNYLDDPLIDANSLKGYDQVIFPGGNSAETLYVENAGIVKPDLLNFVANGGSTVDTCSGAFAAAYAVLNDDGTVKYYGWNIAPRVKAKIFNAVGEVLITITPQGEKILGVNGTIKIDHENGPVFEVEEGVIVLATYASGPYIGQPAVVMDGKQILSGPHWELNIITNADGSSVPQYPDQFLNMIIAAYEGGNNLVDVNNLDNAVNTQISKSDFELMNAAIPVYEELYKKTPSEVYIRKDGVKQSTYISWGKYQSLLTIWNAFIKANNRMPNYMYINENIPSPAPAIGSDQWVLETIERKFGVTIKTKEDLYAIVTKEGDYAEYDNRKYSVGEAVNTYAWSTGINCADFCECIGAPVLRALGFVDGKDFWIIDGMVICSDGTYGHCWITFSDSIPLQTWTASTNPNFF